MKHIHKFMLLAILTVTALACGVISNPLSGAQNLASTAEALASAIPTGLPDVSRYLNPQGEPVSEWNGIPVMSQATAGEEFSKGTYSYRVSGVAEQDIQAFYNDKLKAAGIEPISVGAVLIDMPLDGWFRGRYNVPVARFTVQTTDGVTIRGIHLSAGRETLYIYCHGILAGKDFTLKGMTGRFGNSPFSLEGRITDYPLDHVQHRHCLLADDCAGIHAGIHIMDRATRHLHSVLQGLLPGFESREIVAFQAEPVDCFEMAVIGCSP